MEQSNGMAAALGRRPWASLDEWHAHLRLLRQTYAGRTPWRLTPAGYRALGDRLMPRLSTARGVRELVEMAATGQSLAEVRGKDRGRRAD